MAVDGAAAHPHAKAAAAHNDGTPRAAHGAANNNGLTAIAQLDVGAWHSRWDRVRAAQALEALDRTRTPAADWQGLAGLLSSAAAFVAAMSWGRFITAELDTDGVADGKYNHDQPVPLDWSLVPTVIYLFAVMWTVFFLMHRMHRHRDHVAHGNEIWLEREAQWGRTESAPAPTSSDDDASAPPTTEDNDDEEEEDEEEHEMDEARVQFETERRARRLHAQFLNQAVVNFTNGWTYSSMFMWSVLLHSFTVSLDREGGARAATL